MSRNSNVEGANIPGPSSRHQISGQRHHQRSPDWKKRCCLFTKSLSPKRSVFSLLMLHLVVYVLMYYTLWCIYSADGLLTSEGKRLFEVVAKYFSKHLDVIPLTFILGLYTGFVVKRWVEIYTAIPSTDTLSSLISSYVQDKECEKKKDPCSFRSRLMRRTIVRYANLSFLLAMRKVSHKVLKRFETMEDLIKFGVLMSHEEAEIFDYLNLESDNSEYLLPLVWAGSIVAHARKEGRIREDLAVKSIMDELCSFRAKCSFLLDDGWIPVPKIYTNIVTTAVYTFFLATLMGRQLVDDEMDIFVPIFAFLQFFFFMGLFLLAKSLVNPFGKDHNDFHLTSLIQRNLRVSYLIVDEMHMKHPQMIKDIHWNEVVADEYPEGTDTKHNTAVSV